MNYLITLLISTFIAYPSLVAASDPNLALSKTTYQQLNAWNHNDPSQAFLAFQASCVEILKRDPQSFIHIKFQKIKTYQWQRICRAASKMHPINPSSSRHFFETWFEPYQLAEMDTHHYQGLFTGYYLPLIQGRLHPNEQFHIPIYALPTNLLKINTASTSSSGKPLIRQRKNNMLIPYPIRTEINQGEIHQYAKVLAWSDNAIDVYFAQVQGSAMVELPNKKRFMIGYAGDNGHSYTSIGKLLIIKGEITRENVSMQTIRNWLIRHPEQANNLMNQNDSYVFFKRLNEAHPLGTEKIPLTPQHSLAIDNRYIPFGAPIWLDTTIPNYPHEKNLIPFQKLLIAQDTGGAIKGVVRGDIYWGAGKKAEFIAGRMNSSGESWILLPRSDVKN